MSDTQLTSAVIVSVDGETEIARFRVITKPRDLGWRKAFRDEVVTTVSKGAFEDCKIIGDEADRIQEMKEQWGVDVAMIVMT